MTELKAWRTSSFIAQAESSVRLEEFEYGYLYGPDHDAIIIPSKVVDKPKATVGIGDAISAGAFVAMLARMKQNGRQ